MKELLGIFPGGRYLGCPRIIEDPKKPWVEKTKPNICDACGKKGLITYYREWNGDTRDYKTQCKICGYLDDTGIQLSPEAWAKMPEPTTISDLPIDLFCKIIDDKIWT